MKLCRLFVVKGQNNNVETQRSDNHGVMAVALWPDGRTVATRLGHVVECAPVRCCR
jgi:hypothetical protein